MMKEISIHMGLTNRNVISNFDTFSCNQNIYMELEYLSMRIHQLISYVSAIIRFEQGESVNFERNKCACAGYKLFNGIAHNATRWPQTTLHDGLPSRNQIIEASKRHFVQFSTESAVASRRGSVLQQLDDGCHGDRSLLSVCVYIANYHCIFGFVAEPPHVRL